MGNKVINGVTYYPAAYEGKTEAEFIEHEAHNGTPEDLSKAYRKLTKYIETVEPEPAKNMKDIFAGKGSAEDIETGKAFIEGETAKIKKGK